MNILQKFQQKIWRVLYGIFPRIERKFLFLHDGGRQKYHIGWLSPGHTLAGLKKHLADEWGFGNHFVAWEDKDQVLSWRKLTSFEEQYHVRVYTDGEIRGHYEYTPEAAPLKHFFEQGETEKKDDFLKFLGEFATVETYVSRVSPDTTVPDTDSEITFAA